MGGDARAALARPTSRALLVLAGVAGAWAAGGQGAITRTGGVLGGWQTAMAVAAEAVLALVAVGAAVAGSTRRRLQVDDARHAAGIPPSHRQRHQAGAGAALGVAVLGASSVGAAGAGLVRALADGSGWWASEGYVTGSPATTVAFAARLALGCALLGAGGALAGHLTPRDGVAAATAVAATVPFLSVAGGVAGRTQGVLAVLALTPVGSLRVALLGQQGLAVPGLEQPAGVWPHAMVAGAWLLAIAGAHDAVARRRCRWGRAGATLTTGAPADRTAAPPGRRSAWARPLALVLAATATVATAATVPTRVNDHLPWRWQPEWRAAERAGRSSPQVVGRAVATLRQGGPPPPGVPAGVVDALQRADAVAVAPVAALRAPEEVPVLATFDHPVRTGEFDLRAVVVRFLLAPDGDGWRIVGADGPLAADGARRPQEPAP